MGTGFIGRGRELAELIAGLEDALRGRGRTFFLVGEPGIGKTALAEELAGQAVEHGARAVWGRAWDGDGAPPYWAWAQIIRAVAAAYGDDALRPYVASGLRSLTLLAPELAARFGGTAPTPTSIDSDRGRFALFESVARFLRAASSAQPLVLVLDDVLAGDYASLLLLRFLAREARTAHLLLLATCRDTEATRSPQGIELLAEVVREGHVLELGGLDCEEVRRLIAELTGVVPWPDKVAAIHEATAGNPLFVREVTRLVSADDPLDQRGRLRLSIPATVRTIIRQRLSALSSDAAAALSAAAVVSRDFDASLVEAASELTRERVADALSEAEALGILSAFPDAPGTYRFTHPMMREVVYEGLPPPVRAQMHRQVGQAIERLFGPQAGPYLADLALHFSSAAGSAEADKALQYARKAGDQAMEAWAYEEAGVMYRRALDALEHLDQDAATRCALLLRLGDAQARAAAYTEARASFLRAAGIARQRDDAEQLARAALGFGEQQVGGGLVDRHLIALLQEALDALGPEDSLLRGRLLARLSLELTFSNQDVRRETLSREALEIARRLGDARTLTGAWRARWMAVWGPAGLEERTALSDEMLAAALETRDPEMEVVARARRITCALEAGDVGSLDTEMAMHARLATELRMPIHEWTAASLRAMRALLRGTLAEAELLAEAALSKSAPSNAASAQLGQLTIVRWEQGRLGELRDTWHGFIEQFPQAGFGRGLLCLANAELGRTEEARTSLRAAVDEALALPRNGLWLFALASSTLAAAHLGDADASAVLYPLLLPYADRTVIVPMPHPIACYGSASLYLALLTTATSRWEEAEQHFEAALRTNHRLGAGAWWARTCCEYADMLLRRGRARDRPRVLELLRRAAAANTKRHGLVAIGERIARLQARAEERSRTRRASSDLADRRAGGDPVTVREAVAGKDVFRREGDYWTIIHQDTVARLRDSKGLRCRAQLLARPGREVLAIDLEVSAAREAQLAATGSGVGAADADLALNVDLGDAGKLLDAQAKATYKARLEELREKLAEADAFNDSARAAKAREEIEFLTNELVRAVGLGGRDRRAASQAERARLNVTRAIRAALRNLARVHPSLAEHLSRTIRTGRYCSYAPDPRAPIRWEF